MADPKTPEEPPKLWLARALLWADNPKTPARIFNLLLLICALLVTADFFVHRHAHFDLEKLPGFYAAYGFGAFTFVVFAGAFLRRLIKRDEDYYD